MRLCILITGSNGQLGTDLKRVLQGHDVVALGHQELDITDTERVKTTLAAHRPDMVINTAAYHKVDECESYPEKTFAVNTLGPRNLASTCQAMGIALTHISTNFVFDGYASRPYAEQDLPGPLSVYGASKLAGEHMVRATCTRHFLIRTAGLYGLAQQNGGGKGYNFIELMLKIGRERGRVTVVNDQIFSPTSTEDLAGAIAQLLMTQAYGTYHITNNGACSYWDFARAIFHKAALDAQVEPISTEAYGAKARRPLYSVLDNSRIQAIGLPPLRPWEEALEHYLYSRQASS